MKFCGRGGMSEARATSRKSINLENAVLLTKAPQEGATFNLLIQFIWLSFVFCQCIIHFPEALELCFYMSMARICWNNLKKWKRTYLEKYLRGLFSGFSDTIRNQDHPKRVVSFKERAQRGWKSGARWLSWKSGWKPYTLATTRRWNYPNTFFRFRNSIFIGLKSDHWLCL